MFFLWFWGRPERSMGWAHMQSAHACAVETHFFVFAFFLKNRFHMTSCWLHFATVFWQKSQFWVKKRRSKNCFKKSDPPKSNKSLLTCREAPGEAASRTRFLNKKQLSGQETTTTAHFWVHFWAVVLEWVISESMSGKLLTFWWNLKQKRQVIAEVFAYCPFPKVDDLTRSGPRPGELYLAIPASCGLMLLL